MIHLCKDLASPSLTNKKIRGWGVCEMRGKGFKWNAAACIVVVVTLTGLLPVEILPVVGEAEIRNYKRAAGKKM